MPWRPRVVSLGLRTAFSREITAEQGLVKNRRLAFAVSRSNLLTVPRDAVHLNLTAVSQQDLTVDPSMFEYSSPRIMCCSIQYSMNHFELYIISGKKLNMTAQIITQFQIHLDNNLIIKWCFGLMITAFLY